MSAHNMSFILLQCFLLIFGCNRPHSDYPDYLLPVLENVATTECQSDCFLIIPLEGCKTCIEQTLKYQTKLMGIGAYCIILTRIATRRYAKSYLEAYELGSHPIYYDEENLLDKRGFDSAYPVFISKGQTRAINASVTFNDFKEVVELCRNK